MWHNDHTVDNFRGQNISVPARCDEIKETKLQCHKTSMTFTTRRLNTANASMRLDNYIS